jgi:peptidoglycan/LPS O-acetylase OafA/YrhL
LLGRKKTISAPKRMTQQSRHSQPKQMKHFRSLDGVRAWLAWSVVVFHMILLTAADQWQPILAHAYILGSVCVSCFVIISGFVITHLLLEKKERYLPYIVRRFLRIYPLYICCLALGIIATYWHFSAFSDHPWGNFVPQPDILRQELAGSHGPRLWLHLLAHLTMAHGVISNTVLPMSQFMFLGPAWSASLEWQFYMVAPLILLGLRTRRGQFILALTTVAAFAAFQRGWLGVFYDPSFLPGAGIYFAAGIATRLVYPKLPTLSAYPAAAIILAGGFVLLTSSFLPFFFWLAFITWLRVEHASDPISCGIHRFADVVLNSKLARYLGTRSYSTYLVHEPIIHSVVYVCIRKFALGIAPTVAVTFVTVPIMTLGASILLYRYVESPCIAYGKRLFNDPDPTGANEPSAQGAGAEPRIAAVAPGS